MHGVSGSGSFSSSPIVGSLAPCVSLPLALGIIFALGIIAAIVIYCMK